MPEPMTDDQSPPEPGAEPRPAADDLVSRARLRRALLRPSRGQLIVAVLLALLGYAAVTQVRFTNVDDTYASLREQDLIALLKGLDSQTQRADSEIARLQRTRDELRSDTGAREVALAQAEQQADTYAMMAGLVPVTGPGIRLTITETEGSVEVDSMVDMIQELRSGGAEAIQLNERVRVVAQTSFEDAVGGIAVDGQVISSPYVVDAIGAPDALEGAVNFPKGPRDQFEDQGATVEVDQRARVDITAVVEPRRLEYADPGSAQ
jgi:uncharacterized protein YlxW (UPF0749 family)